MHKKPEVLFVHQGASSFVKEDIKILQAIASIRIFHFPASKSPLTLLIYFVRQFFWLIYNFKSADIIYCWFSDYHSFLPAVFSSLFKKPIITVLGGFDCNKIESLNYGIFCSKWRSPLGKFVIRKSTLLLPVDETLIKTSPSSKLWGEAHPNGLMHNIQGFNTAWQEVPTGYDANIWETSKDERLEIVTTVALCSNHRTALIKGWDLFIEASKLLPDFKFNIVGATPEFMTKLMDKYKPGANLEFIPPLPREGLKTIYQKTSVFVQLSRAEGLPNVLCEAMMCGCVPVGSAVFGIPNGIGDTGFIATKPEPTEIARLIKKAHEDAGELRIKARNRIIDNFSLTKRAQRLNELISTLT